MFMSIAYEIRQDGAVFDYLLLGACSVASGNGPGEDVQSGHKGDEFPGVDRVPTAFIQKNFSKWIA